jgi:hypothetical protein
MNAYCAGIDRRPTALFAPVMTICPPGYSFSSIVLPLSRTSDPRPSRATRGVTVIRVEPLPAEALREVDGRLDEDHRARGVVDHVAHRVQDRLGAADLRALHEDDLFDFRRRRQAVHDLAQVRRAVRPPRPGLRARLLRQPAIPIGPLRDEQLRFRPEAGRRRLPHLANDLSAMH